MSSKKRRRGRNCSQIAFNRDSRNSKIGTVFVEQATRCPVDINVIQRLWEFHGASTNHHRYIVWFNHIERLGPELQTKKIS